MRLLVILSPTDKWGTKTEYTKLRKFLQRDGYIRIAPKTGVVRLLRLTEKQYNNIYMLTGEADYQEKNGWGKLPHCDIIICMEKVMKQVKLYIVVEKIVHN